MDSRTLVVFDDVNASTVVSSPKDSRTPSVKCKGEGELPLSYAIPIVDESPENVLAAVSNLRKYTLLAIFALAQFLDSFNNSALLPALPAIISSLNFYATETVWIISAYQLTFAAFLLVSGRISDVYTPKPAFIAGGFILGVTHLIGGFMNNKIGLLVFRALGGIGGALTIPSALSLIVQQFPDQTQQARAISLFGSAGAVGNILGVIIGALLVEYTSWRWIFWLVAIVGVGIAAVCLFLIPTVPRPVRERKVHFDSAGVSVLTIAVILFIFAVTSGGTKGWGTAYVLAPLIISLALTVAFLFWEARLDPDDAVLPPRMWRFRNFGVLVGLALLPYFWWITSFVLLTQWWETVFGWSALSTAVHFLPLGIVAGAYSFVAGYLPKYIPHKWIIFGGGVLALISSILLPFGDSPSVYWSINFPAFVVGSLGCMVVFSNSNIAIFHYTPPRVAGTVGAVFNCALQLSSAVGLAAVTSIQTSVKSETPLTIPLNEWPSRLSEVTKSQWKAAFHGYSAAYWFLVAFVVLQLINLLIFFRVDPVDHEERDGDISKREDEKKENQIMHEEGTLENG